MAGNIRQWDTDHMDQFKRIFPTTFSNLQIYPGNPIDWIPVKDMAFGEKQAQRNIRTPDQGVQVAKEVKYIDKRATRIPQVADMPALFDSLIIPEEDYAGDVVNALGHVADLFENFNDGIVNFTYNGTTIDPTAYGLMDAGAGTGSTTSNRPDKCTDVTPSGNWDVQKSMFIDIAQAQNNLEDKGFFGPKRLIAPPLLRPLMSTLLTSTVTPYRSWITSIAGFPITFTPFIDPDATTALADVYMVDESAFDLFMTPMKVRGFFNNDDEMFKWHWKTRAYLLPRPKWDDTDWKKATCKIAQLDWIT
jgi:hypothetical protein